MIHAVVAHDWRCWWSRPRRDAHRGATVAVDWGSRPAPLVAATEATQARVDEEPIRVRVERARGGDAAAFGELAEALRPDVQRLCARMLGGVDAEDAAHESFQRAQQRLGDYDPARSFRTWLLSIASNHCVDRLRRRSVEKRLFADEDASGVAAADRPAPAATALEGLVRAETRARVQAALDRLPDRYRAPLVLRYFSELGYDAIGEQLGIPRTQVATLLFRGKQRLRELLREGGEGEA